MGSNDTAAFTVEKADLTAKVTAQNVTVEQDTSFVIDVTKDFNGNVSITADNKELYNGPADTIVNGIKLLEGDKTATVKFYGDTNYEELTLKDVKFTVSRVTPEINAKINDVTYPDKAVATVTVSNNANGTVEITVDGKKFTKEVKNGKATVELTGLGAGDKVAEVQFITGDDYNNNASTTAKFTVNKADTPISLEVEEGIVGQLTNISVEIDAPGIVSVKVNDTIVYVGPADGSVVIPVSGLTAGDYDVVAEYYGDNNHKANSTSDSFTVGKNSTYNFDATPTVKNQTLIIDIDLPDDATGNITVTINDENITVPVTDTIALDLEPGTYDVNVTYNGDDKYEPKTKELGNITIPTIDDYDIVIESNGTDLIITLPEDINGNVTVDIDGNETVVPVVNGTAVVPIDDLEPGDHDVNVTYPGDDKYSPNSNETTINVPTIDDYDIVIESNGTDLIITLPEDINGNVTVDIDGNETVVPVVNGTAVVPIDDLEPGDHDVNVTYPGDDKYSPNSNETTINVPTIDDYPFVVDAVVNGSDADITVTLPDDIDGVVLIDVDDVGYYANATDGKAKLHLSDLPDGIHNVTAKFLGDDKYSPNENSTSFTTSGKVTPDMDVKVDVPNKSITVELPDDATGNVTATIDGKDYTAPIVDGKAVIPLDDLEPGDYEAEITYPGDDKYAPADKNTTFTVPRIDDYPFVVDAVVNGSDADITVTLPDDIDGVVLIDVDDVGYYANATDGKAKLHLSDLPDGIHNVTAKFLGDDKYSPNENSTSFTTSGKVTPDMDVKVDVPNKSITVELPDDATGNVTATIDGKDYTAPIVDGKAVIPLDDLEPGDYEAEITYPGDDKYAPADKNTTFTVPRIDDYDINITAEDDNVVITLPEDINGKAKVNIDGKDYTVDVVNGTAVVPNVAPGNHDVTVTYPGDDKYAPKTANTTVFISGVIINVDDLVKYYSGPQRLNVSITDTNGKGIANKVVKITINGITYTRTTKNDGSVSLPVNLNVGNYTAHVEVGEYKFSKDVNVEVKHTIFGSDVVKVFRNGTHYYALFLDGYGNPLVNTSVSYNIHGVFYNRTTNASGWSKLNINIERGEYILTALNTVTGEMASNLITVYTQLETQDLVKYYRNGTQFICRVVAPDKSYAGAGERVDFNIHGRLYTRYTNATGHISLNIDIEPGEYHITSYYQQCVEGNKIIVLPVLSADDLSMRYRDGSKFTAKVLDGQGNPYPNQVVTFNINGVFYNRTTDRNGEAKLNINLQSGQYIITSTYNECSVSNKITIKN